MQRALYLARTVDEARAVDLVLLDVAALTPLCSYFIICHSRSGVHAEAIVERVVEQAKAGGIRLHHREGTRRGEWVILDYMDVIVHIFSEEARGFYDLERLWADAKRVEWQEEPAPAGASGSGAENHESAPSE